MMIQRYALKHYVNGKKLVAGALLALCLIVALAIYMKGWAAVQAKIRPSDGLAFEFETDAGVAPERIRCVQDGDDLCRAFLPPCADPARMTVALEGERPLYLDGERLRDGLSLGTIDLEAPHTLSDGRREEQLLFTISAGVPTLFVRTISGNMDAVDADKTLKESTFLTLYDEDGSELYRSDGLDKIRGRGNWTWKQDKKGYTLFLKHAADWFGMGKAKKWILLANIKDDTNMRNWLALTLAKKVGDYNFFAPECTFVELYLNGRCHGLYLLCEKIELRSGRLEIPQSSWLFQLDMAYRIRTMKNAFVLDSGPAVEVDYPTNCNVSKRQVLKKHLTDFESALFAEDGISPTSGKSWLDFIDLDSFAEKFLIDEITQNNDAGAGSQFYYWNGDDGKLYGGPCWDYDDSMGVAGQNNPNCFTALRPYKRSDVPTPWYPALWKHQEFRDRVIELYRDEIAPALRELLTEEIPRLAEALETANAVNRLRWHSYYEAHTAYASGVDYLKEYAELHLEFLDSAWLEGVDYRTVTFALGDKANYQFFCMPVGASCAALPSPQYYRLPEGAVWRTADGVPFDLNQDLVEDIMLYSYEPNVKKTGTAGSHDE